jgi:hypothetical protein
MDVQFIKHMIKRNLIQYGGEHKDLITEEELNKLCEQILHEQEQNNTPLHEAVNDIIYDYITNK